MLVSENQAKTSLVNYGAKDVTHDLIKYSFPQRYAESYVNAMDHFLDALKGNKYFHRIRNDRKAICRPTYNSLCIQ